MRAGVRIDLPVHLFAGRPVLLYTPGLDTPLCVVVGRWRNDQGEAPGYQARVPLYLSTDLEPLVTVTYRTLPDIDVRTAACAWCDRGDPEAATFLTLKGTPLCDHHARWRVARGATWSGAAVASELVRLGIIQ